MSKEDRYAHLGDGIEATTDDTDADGAGDTLRVTIEDGDETTVLRVDPDAASAEDVREAVEGAGDAPEASDPGRLALELGTLGPRLVLELGTLGPRLALRGVESLVDGLQVDRTRD